MSQLSLSPNITTLERPSRWKIWLALSSPVLLLGLAFGYLKYSQQKYLPIVMAVTNVFHARLAGGEDSLIYREADPAWKAALSEDAEQKFFSRIRRKLGACSYSGPLRMFFNANTN